VPWSNSILLLPLCHTQTIGQKQIQTLPSANCDPSAYSLGRLPFPGATIPNSIAGASCQCLDVVDAIADDPPPFAPLKRTSREIPPSTPHKLPPPQLDELKPMAFASRKAVLSELLQCQ